MKKWDQPLAEKEKDRTRLRALTKANDNNQLWFADGQKLPKFVSYELGLYIELDLPRSRAWIEEYERGAMARHQTLPLEMPGRSARRHGLSDG